LVLAGAPALAETTAGRAPFGLTWGQSAEEVRTSGVTLPSTGAKTDYGLAYEAEGLKAILSDTETVRLFFGYHDRLWRIVAASRPMGPDPHGIVGIQRYEELMRLLTERYGKGREVDQHDPYSNQPQMYVFYLQHGNARRYVDFTGEGMNVQLGLRGDVTDMTR